MSYLRANGRVAGRVSGRWGRASVQGSYSLGDIAGIGGGLEVVGDPVLALVMQLNRFAGKSFNPGPGCQSRRYVATAFPLSPTLTDAAATAAAIIVHDRYYCVPTDTFDAKKVAWASAGLSGDSRAWALANIRELVTTIALFGDKLGLPAAPGGISAAPGIANLFKRKLATSQIIMLGGVGLAALLLLRKR